MISLLVHGNDKIVSLALPTFFQVLIPADAVTTAFLLVMIAFFTFVFLKVILPFKHSNTALAESIKQINACESENISQKELIEKLSADEHFLNNPNLRAYWDDYLRDAFSVGNHPELCRIDEYFCDDTVLHTIGKSQFADMAPGIFTTLGILGTFMGLVMGLQQFTVPNGALLPQQAQQVLSNSTTQLIEGIKVAFQTSVYGILFSLTFNAIYRRLAERARHLLDGFVSAYQTYIVPDSAQKPFSTLVELQRQETEQMKLFAESFSLSMTESLNKTFLPTLEKLDSLMGRFISVASERQAEGLEKIVNNFVSNMNQSLGDQFNILADQLVKINEWQQTVHMQSTELIDKINSTAAHIFDIDQKSMNVIQHFDLYLDKLQLTEQRASVGLDKIIEVSSQVSQSIETQREGFEKLNAFQRDNLNQMTASQLTLSTEYGKLADKMTSFSDSVSANIGQSRAVIEQMTRTVSDSVKTIQTTTSTLLKDMSEGRIELSEGIAKGYEKTFEVFDKSLAEIAMHLSGTINRIQESVFELPSLIEKINKNTTDQMAKMSSSILQTESALKQNIAPLDNALKSIESSLKTWQTEITRMSDSIHQLNGEINDGRVSLKESGAFSGKLR